MNRLMNSEGVVKLERVRVRCAACGEVVDAVAADGRVKGYCGVAKKYVNFPIETQRITPVKRWQNPDEVKDGVVRDYKVGDGVIVIQGRYNISPGKMYRILGGANVELRTDRKSKNNR